MNAAYRQSFTRDLKKIKDRSVLDRVRQAIHQVEAADTLQEIGDVRKITGTTNSYRIRVGQYRIGVVVDSHTVEFVRCLPRRDLYRFFP